MLDYDSFVFTWGKHKGESFLSVFEKDVDYLKFIIRGDNFPLEWRKGAARVIKGVPIADLPLPRRASLSSQVRTVPVLEAGIIKLILHNSSTVLLYTPYNPDLIELLKKKLDGAKWNPKLRAWQFPLVHLNVALEVLKDYTVQYDDTIMVASAELATHRLTLSNIQESLTNDEYAKKFYDPTVIGKITNWTDVYSLPELKAFIKR